MVKVMFKIRALPIHVNPVALYAKIITAPDATGRNGHTFPVVRIRATVPRVDFEHTMDRIAQINILTKINNHARRTAPLSAMRRQQMGW